MALWMLLIALVMAGGYAFYRTANTQFSRTQQDNKLALAMAQAKEALIAYAVTDSDRPGSLPCPDLATDSVGFNNFPGDGKTDMFTVNQCPIYVGWLPWVTLDLPELTDNTGTRLWYVLAPALRNHDSAQPINSERATGLLVDGSSEIAALIIAPRTPLAGQNRPSNNPGDYLDGENANGNDHTYVTGPQGENFNDIVLVITRQELMAAVEKRVANEIRNCVEQHASSAANPSRRYPWPAPFSAVNRQGKAGSLFGRIPTSQPGSGPEAALKSSISRLSMTRDLVSSAGDANQQLTALSSLGAELVVARNLFETLYLASNQLKQTADETVSQMQSLEKTIDSAVIGGRISVKEGEAIRNKASASDTSLASLPNLLTQLGVDVFPWELARRRSSLANASTAGALLAETQAIRDLLLASTTPRVDIDPKLLIARNAAVLASDSASLAASTAADSALLDTARSAANALLGALVDLQAGVEASRVSVLSSEITSFIGPLDNRNANLRNAPTPENIATLLTELTATKVSLEQIASGVNDVIAARNTTVAALEAARLAAQSGFPDYSLIDGKTTAASGALQTLALAIAANEAVDNNVSHTSLNAAITAYNSSSSAFTLIDTSSPRPVQSSIAPYAVNLANAAVNIDLWAKIISANASAVAPLAKAATVSANIDPAQALALDTSAYQAAASALASITGNNAAAAALRAYIATPSTGNQATATTRLAQTLSLVNALMEIANALDTQLSGTTASAQAMIWASATCDFLRPGQSSWWNNNQWANTVFYQIAGPLHSTAGSLTVNATGSYPIVVLAAGQAFPGQNRGTPASAQFFEGINADASRDGDATAPAPGFSALPPSATFNDRLAY